MGIVAVAQLEGHAGPGAWWTVCATLTNLVILVMAVGQRNFQMNWLDWVSLTVCVAAVIGWALSSNALVAVVMVSALEVFAYVPTLQKSWKRPYEETVSLYAMSFMTQLISLFALNAFTGVTAIYPIVLLVLNFFVTAILVVRRRVNDSAG